MRPKYIERLKQGVAISAAALTLNGCDDTNKGDGKAVPLRSDMLSKCIKGVPKLLMDKIESFGLQESDLDAFAKMVNELRAEKKLPPLTYGECAQKMAEYWAKHSKAPAGGHEADGETPSTRMRQFRCASAVEEIVSSPNSFDPAHIFQQMKDVPGDRAKMESAKTTEMGLHCVNDTDVKSGRFCVMVGTKERQVGVLDLDEDNFPQEVLDVKDRPVLVEFWADWCGYCDKQDLILQQLYSELGDKVVIAKVKVDDDGGNDNLQRKYGSKSFPTLTIFKDGKVHCKWKGLHQKSVLRRILKRHMSKKSD